MNTQQHEVRFHLAGLEVAVRSASADGLSGLSPRYLSYPSRVAANVAPALDIEIMRFEGFIVDDDHAEPGPEFPAFHKSVHADGRIMLARYDADGWIALPPVGSGDTQIRAQFRVGISANSLEACVRIALSVALPTVSAFLFHSSTVQGAHGRALTFTGVSGAGKSTISELLDSLDGVTKIVDELGVIKVTEHGAEVHTAPFLGIAGMPLGVVAPLSGIHFLIQAPHDRRTLVPPRAAMSRVMANILAYVAEPTTAERLLELVARLTTTTPCYNLEFAKHADVAAVLDIA